MKWTQIAAGLSLSWDTETDEAHVLIDEDISPFESFADGDIETVIFRVLGRKCQLTEFDAVNEGKAEAVAGVIWTELTPSQRFELLVIVETTAQAFVSDFNEPLDSAATDWDATAWDEDQANLSFREVLKKSQPIYETAWEFYREHLEAATTRMCD